MPPNPTVELTPLPPNGGDSWSRVLRLTQRVNDIIGALIGRTTTTITLLGNLFTDRIYPGSQTTRYIDDDGSHLQFVDGIVVQGAIPDVELDDNTSSDADAFTFGMLNGRFRNQNILAFVRFLTDGTTAGDRGGRISFGTKVDGASAAFERAYLAQDGHWYFAGRLYPGNQATRYISDDGTHTSVSAGLSVVGGQIKFPATQSASSDANTLDDYEEGTWTPTILKGGVAVTSYTIQVGTYTKIGNRVICQGQVVVNVIGADTGALTIGGLPFASSSTTYNRPAAALRCDGLANLTTQSVQAFIDTGVQVITLESFTNGTSTPLTEANLSAGASNFIMNFSYAV